MNSSSTAILCTFALSIFAPSLVLGQTDFFYSLADLNGGAQNSSFDGNFSQGDSGSLFIYYTTNGPVDADLDLVSSLDIQSSSPEVIQFTTAETFEFPIMVGETTIGYRWTADGISGNGGYFGAPLGGITDDQIDSLVGFRVDGGVGMVESNTGPIFLDAGYDANVDAFLFGRIDFNVVGSIGESTQLLTSPGSEGLDTQGAGTPTFGSATINVVATVPEPCSTMVMISGLALALTRRRR